MLSRRTPVIARLLVAQRAHLLEVPALKMDPPLLDGQPKRIDGIRVPIQHRLEQVKDLARVEQIAQIIRPSIARPGRPLEQLPRERLVAREVDALEVEEAQHGEGRGLAQFLLFFEDFYDLGEALGVRDAVGLFFLLVRVDLRQHAGGEGLVFFQQGHRVDRVHRLLLGL